ncbi:MAG: hypothetical protein KME17_26050 [Cyanosarcina radialis HA8281-LM2]|jgi:hypothetical protein|nr:hypothetical protein [Cyanosarcina radialis HA8281-LM2]
MDVKGKRDRLNYFLGYIRTYTKTLVSKLLPQLLTDFGWFLAPMYLRSLN